MKYYIKQADGSLVPVESGGMVDQVEVLVANKTLTVEDSGKTFLFSIDGIVVTLPATIRGLEYTFINFAAATVAAVTVSPAAADGIAGTVTLAASVVVLDGTVDKDAINTKASSENGDAMTIVGSGTTGTRAWQIKYSTGIWAQEA